MGSFTYQTIVIVLIGAAVFVLGTSNMRGHFRMKRPGVVFKGKVLSAKLVERRDQEDRLVQHYYDLLVQCHSQGKTFNHKMKSTREYEKGDEICLMNNAGQIVPVNNKAISLGIAFLIALAGMLLAVFPVVYQNVGEKEGSLVLTVLLVLAGCITLLSYRKERGRKLTEIKGKIVDVLYYRTGDNKKLSKPVESYYPLIQCTLDGKEKVFLSSYNSSRPNVYKKGAELQLFYDDETGSIVEKRTSPILLVVGAGLWCLALIGLISSLM